MSIKIFIVDDHYHFRTGIKKEIEAQSDMEVVGEADDGQVALDKVKLLKPDMAILDIEIPTLHGTEVASRITESSLTKVIAMSAFDTDSYIQQMFKAGAKGYILKRGEKKELIFAIREVAEGKTYISTGLKYATVDEYMKHFSADGSDPLTVLTIREREVLQYILKGLTPYDIADELSISHKTARVHRQHIMEKLEMKNLVELIKFSVANGITSNHLW